MHIYDFWQMSITTRYMGFGTNAKKSMISETFVCKQCVVMLTTFTNCSWYYPLEIPYAVDMKMKSVLKVSLPKLKISCLKIK